MFYLMDYWMKLMEIMEKSISRAELRKYILYDIIFYTEKVVGSILPGPSTKLVQFGVTKHISKSVI
jgi:hypothetical protein